MWKFRRIVKFIKKYRAKGIASFDVVTTSDTIILYVIDKDKRIDDQIRIRYN